MSVNAVGLTVRVGDGDVTVKVTGIETGATPPVKLTVISALWVPAGNVPVVARAVIVPLPVPEREARLNHEALSLTVQAPVEVMAMV